MNSGTWVCEGVSVAGSNRTVPGRGEGAADLRAGGKALVLLSSLEDTVAHRDLLLPLGPIPVNTTTIWLPSQPPLSLSSHHPRHPRSGPSLVFLPLVPPSHPSATSTPPPRVLSRTYMLPLRASPPFHPPACHSSSFSQTPLFSETLPPNSSLVYTSEPLPLLPPPCSAFPPLFSTGKSHPPTPVPLPDEALIQAANWDSL